MFQKQDYGYLIVYGGQVFKLDLVMTSVITHIRKLTSIVNMTSVIILGILAGIMYGGVILLEKFILKSKKFR